MSAQPLLVILGPTASGKTKLAVQVARELDGEIISADSRQVFKGMDIGTGKDLSEYTEGGAAVPYHLIDHLEAGSRYQVDAFQNDFYEAFTDITGRSKQPILCGGTGMYIHSLLQQHAFTAIPVNQPLREELLQLSPKQLQATLNQYPAALRQHADQSTSKRLIRAIEIAAYLAVHPLPTKERPPLKPLVVGLDLPVDLRRARIAARLDERLEAGLVQEVEQLLIKGVTPEMLVFYGLEYKFVILYLDGHLSYAEFRERLYNAICQYAKRQMTFFRKMKKDGVAIHWFSSGNSNLQNEVISLFKATFGV